MESLLTPLTPEQWSTLLAPATTAPEGILWLYEGQYALQLYGEGRIRWLDPAAVRGVFAHEPVDTGWLPRHVMRWGQHRTGSFVVSSFPPATHTLLIEQDRATDEVTVPLPGAIFAGLGSTYLVWAVTDDPPGEETLLYHMPLCNVESQGRIC